MQKFQISDVQGIQKHNQRQGKSKSNLDIDYSKSEQNYDLLNQQKIRYESTIKQEISERVKRKPRANSVVLSEFVVTASPDYMHSLSLEEQKRYFESSLDFIQKRYGKQNTLYAMVHMDEATPHMHIGVMPITEDNRLSAKDMFTRKGVPPAFRKKTTLRKSELKNQKIYHYSKTHTVSFFIQKIIQHNINCVVLGVIININLGV
ncbi:MobV family relaxase [Bacillus thuringiensis]|uniref:MobV family relaxase n=1 Tax=Bacillus thuringiensis TaxID=1428 RepID=UPI001F460A1B|nr:MobV family relaxase [Bacillus thuringiensis]